MKKLVAMLISIMMLLGVLAGCGSSGTADEPKEPESEVETAEGKAEETEEPEATGVAASDLPQYKMGVIYYSLTDLLGSETVRQLQYFGDNFNVEMQFIQAVGTEETLAAVENLCSSGCNGIISYVVDASLPRILEICEGYDCYYGAISRRIPSEEIVQEIAGKSYEKYWVGGCSENDYQAGKSMIETLAAAGKTKFALTGRAEGLASAHDDRWSGFMDAFAENPDLEIVAEVRVTNTTTELMPAINDIIGLGTDMDALVCTGGGMTYGLQPLESAGLSSTVALGTVDIDVGAEEALESGAIGALLGGQAIDAVFSAINLYNVIDGQPLREEPADLVLNYVVIDSLETYNTYLEYCEGDAIGMNAEEIGQFIKRINPDATYEDLEAFVSNYSLDDVIERHSK